jgi:hypothetical protein
MAGVFEFTLRIPDNLHARAVDRAATGHRPLNSEMLHLLGAAPTTTSPDTPDHLDGNSAISDPPPVSCRGRPHRGKPDSPTG